MNKEQCIIINVTLLPTPPAGCHKYVNSASFNSAMNYVANALLNNITRCDFIYMHADRLYLVCKTDEYTKTLKDLQSVISIASSYATYVFNYALKRTEHEEQSAIFSAHAWFIEKELVLEHLIEIQGMHNFLAQKELASSGVNAESYYLYDRTLLGVVVNNSGSKIADFTYHAR